MKPSTTPERWLWLGIIPGLLVTLLPPLTMLIISFCEARFPSLPWPGWSFQWYLELSSDAALQDSLGRSALVGLGAALPAAALGYPAGYWLSRLPPKSALYTLTIWTAPVFVPFLLFGLSFLQLARLLGIERTLGAVALGHATLFSPVVVALVFHRCRQLDSRIEMAARELGASEVRVLFAIVGRQAWGTILGAASLVFILSWDEYTLAWFVGGFENTYPVQLSDLLESTFSPEIHAAGVVVAAGSLLLAFIASALLIKEAK